MAGLCREELVGITEYLNKDNPGFRGTIKERYSDFNVNEIAPDGSVVHLTCQDLPEDLPAQDDGEPVHSDEHVYAALTPDQQTLLTELQYAKLKVLAGDSNATHSVELDITGLSKEQRKAIHFMVKSFQQLDSNTLERGAQKLIMVQRKGPDTRQVRRQRDRPPNRFLHFTLYKENTDTYEAISLIANKCHTDEKRFGVAGTKDRRGRTAQRVSVTRLSPKQILGAVRYSKLVHVGNFAYADKEIRLGDLAGNRFELVMRNIDRSADELAPILEAFQQNGFINYFGMQRFGTTSIPTHTVGMALLSSDWSKAIDLIMQPRDETDPVMREARKIYREEKNAQKALDVLRRGRRDRTVEGKLLYGLTQNHMRDQVGALGNIPRGSRQMYCHAYQSYLWNRVASRRVAEFGRKVLVGDLVRAEGGEDVKTVEQPEDHSVHHILLPLPGHKIRYPENECGTWYTEIMAEDKISPDCWKNSVRDYSMPGDYRPLLVKASDVSWRTVRYNDPKEDLLLSDLDKMEMKANGTEESVIGTGTVDGKHSALILGLSLPTCSYATMALREIMRVATDKLSLMAGSKSSTEEEQPSVPEEDKTTCRTEVSSVSDSEGQSHEPAKAGDKEDPEARDGGDHEPRGREDCEASDNGDHEARGREDHHPTPLDDEEDKEPAVKKMKTDL